MAIGAALIAGLALFACIFVTTRRLGMGWRRQLGAVHLEMNDAISLMKLLIGVETVADQRVQRLVWAVRGLWVAMVVSVVVFMVMLAGVG